MIHNSEVRDLDAWLLSRSKEMECITMARRFHRWMERLFHATRTDGHAIEDPRETFIRTQRSWKRLQRVLKAFERVGGDPSQNAFIEYHVSEALTLWIRILNNQQFYTAISDTVLAKERPPKRMCGLKLTGSPEVSPAQSVWEGWGG